MKAKGIDPKKMQAEIDDLKDKIAEMNKSNVKLIDIHVGDSPLNYSAKDYFDDPDLKKLFDENFAHLKEMKKNGTLTSTYDKDHYAAYEKFFDDIEKAQSAPKEIDKLNKLLKTKTDELEKVRKRYGLEDGKFSQERKDKACWFKKHEEADDVLRAKSGEVWQKASSIERESGYRYTAGSGAFNRPLRGYDGSWSKFKGVGNVPLNNEGAEDLIKGLTDMIDKSTYDVDMWLNRGVESTKGAASFLGIDEKIFENATEKELQDLLVGKKVTDHAFTSSSPCKGSGFSGPLTVNIFAPKGTKMIYAEPFSCFGSGAGRSWDGKSRQSSFGHEFEMILQRGTRFKITKVEKVHGRVFVDVDVISQLQ